MKNSVLFSLFIIAAFAITAPSQTKGELSFGNYAGSGTPFGSSFIAIPYRTDGSSTTRAPGWGVEVGRADASDIGELLADQNTLRLALSRIRTITAKELGTERQRALLGIESEGMSPAELLTKAQDWWKDNIEGSMDRIASNPAASCAESQEMFSLLLGNERQKALLGIEGMGNIEIFTGTVATSVKKRCREEKLDECNATGRFKQIILWAVLEERQVQILSGSASDDSWMKDALTECAIYELHYVSTTKVDYDLKLDSVIDGRIPLKFKPNEGGLYAELSDIKIEGETNSDVNPFLQSIKCTAEGITTTCGPGASMLKTAFSAIVDLEVKYREDYLDESGLSKSRIVGDNKLKIKFSPSMHSTAMVTKAMKDIPSMTLPNLEVGATGFWIAHKKSRTGPLEVTFDETERGVYPILFEFTRTGGDSEEDITAFDTTKFELIHKPNKKPFPPKKATPARRMVRGTP